MPWRFIQMISDPRPWKDPNLRIGLVVGVIACFILVISQGLIYGFFPALSILIIYLIVVPWAMRSGYVWGWDACVKEYLQKHSEFMESLDQNYWIDRRTWQRAVVIEGETDDTQRDPSQLDPRQLP